MQNSSRLQATPNSFMIRKVSLMHTRGCRVRGIHVVNISVLIGGGAKFMQDEIVLSHECRDRGGFQLVMRQVEVPKHKLQVRAARM